MSEHVEEGDLTPEEPVIENAELSPEDTEEYTPNYSYNFKDEERSFDERLHGAIKTKEDEDYIRDLITRSEGLDDIKADRDKWKTDHGQVHEQAGLLSKGYQNMVDWREKGELDKLFTAFKLDDQAIIDYALRRAEFYEKSEEEQAKINADKSTADEVAALRAEVAGFKTERGQASVQQEIASVDVLVASEEHKPVFDALVSKGIVTNARDVTEMVIEYGMGVFQRTGKEPSIDQAVNQVMARYQGLVPAADLGEGNGAPAEGKPTLPRLNGGGGKPVSRPIGSLQQLKDLAAQIET